MTVRVAVVARSAVLRSGLEALLGAAPSLVVVGSVAEGRAGDGEGASLLELVAPLAPDVVVWVADGGPASGAAELLAPLREERGEERGQERGGARPAVVVLADLFEPRTALAALRSGARGVLAREAGADEIVAAVEAVAAGLLVVPAEVGEELLAGAGAAIEASLPAVAAPAVLSPREREVLALLAQGLANKAIAPRLGISEHTVKAHVASIFEKLHAGTRAEAVVTAARQGLLML